MELDRRIRDGLYPNCLTFSAEWEVSQKTIQRDIDYLRDQCGAPIRYDREEKGYYYDDATWVLPSIMLSEGELLAILVGARAVSQYKGTPIEARLRRVFDKLTELLPEGLSIHPAELFTDFSFQSPPSRPVDPDVWVTEREWHPTQQIKRRKDGDIELSFPAKGLFEVQRWVLSWGRYVRVLAPNNLVNMVKEEIEAMAGAQPHKG